MKKFLTIIMAAAITSCSESKSEPDDTAEPEQVAEKSIAEQFSELMVSVQGGTFQMGQSGAISSKVASDAKDDDSPRTDELPVHQVTVSDFQISRYEITQELWISVMGENPSYFAGKGENLPVESVSWDEVQEFIARLNALTGEEYRLPTEAEWEFAARGGNLSKGFRYCGSNAVSDVAWYADNSPEMICPVGGKTPNELGLYDMSGNAFEWVYDWYGAYTADSMVNPKGPSSGTYHVLRGGSWKHSSNGCRVSFRTHIPTYHLNKCGFRIAKGISLDTLPWDDSE